MTEYGNLKPDDDLTEIFTKVVKDVSADDYGSVKTGANTALLLTLQLLEQEDPDAVAYHLSRQDYGSLQALQDAVRSRQQQDFVLSGVVDMDSVSMDDSGFNAELKDSHDGQSD